MKRSNSRSTRKKTTKRRRFSPSDVSKLPCDGKVMAPGTIRINEDFSIPVLESSKSLVKEERSKNNKTKIPIGKNKQGVLDSVLYADLDNSSDNVKRSMRQLSNNLNVGKKSSYENIYIEILELKSKVDSMTKAFLKLTAEIESLKTEVQNH